MWAAGLFEGEGSISTWTPRKRRQGRVRWQLALEMIDEDVVRRFAEVVGVGAVRKAEPRGLGKQPRFCWDTGKRASVYYVLAMLFPFLGRRRQARAREALLALPPVRYGSLDW